MAFYLLVAHILLLNLLIAIFNNTFSEIQANSNQIWKFQRHDLIMEYSQRPVLVPPLIILNHVIELLCCCWDWLCCCRDDRKCHKALSDNRLKLFLDKNEKEELLMFEEHCLYIYLHHKDNLFNATPEERVRVIGNRVEFVATQVEEMTGKVKTLENNSKKAIELLNSLRRRNPERVGLSADTDDDDATSSKESSILSNFSTKRSKLSSGRSPSPERRASSHVKETARSKSVSQTIAPDRKRRRRSEGSGSKSPVDHQGHKSPRARRSPSELSLLRKHRRSHDIVDDELQTNIKSRRSPYPMTTIERCPVTEQQVDWETLMPWYNPPQYTADTIAALSSDPDLHSISTNEVKISFNEFDGDVYRKSHTGVYGLPRNPVGRTGLSGRGLLEYWGPNHNACHIITRWRKKPDGTIVSRDDHEVLEFMAWKTGDKWVLPEEKIIIVPENTDDEERTFDHVVSNSFKNQFYDQITFEMPDASNDEKDRKKKLIEEQLFQRGNEMFRGYIDDERNTDNAWLEFVVNNYHDDTGEILRNVYFTGRNEPCTIAWFMVSGQIDLPENHVTMLREVARFHNAYY